MISMPKGLKQHNKELFHLAQVSASDMVLIGAFEIDKSWQRSWPLLDVAGGGLEANPHPFLCAELQYIWIDTLP